MKEGQQSPRGLNTNLIHAAEGENPSSGLTSPIYQSATFHFEEPEAIAQAMAAEAHPQFYGRYATPNTKQVEATVAYLEGAEAALANFLEEKGEQLHTKIIRKQTGRAAHR